MAPFEGFPDNSEYTPDLDQLLGGFQRSDMIVLACSAHFWSLERSTTRWRYSEVEERRKCFLRVLWLHSQLKKGGCRNWER